MSTTRKPAPRLARPAARYWKGKLPKGAAVAADSDSDEEEEAPEQEDGDVPIEDDQDFADEEDIKPALRPAIKPGQTKAINVALKDVNISTDGKVIVAGREESGRTAMEGKYSNIMPNFLTKLQMKRKVPKRKRRPSLRLELKAKKR